MFTKMAEIIKPCSSTNFSVIHETVTREKATISNLRALFNHRPSEVITEGVYTILKNKHTGEIIMSDTPMEHDTNKTAVEKATGNVLIAGLGIGMILLPIQLKQEVTQITVVEKHQELIDLIAPQLPLNKKVNIVSADIHEFKTDQKYDTIYFDIWSYIDGNTVKEHDKLRRQFQRNLNENNPLRYMGSWRYNDCRRKANDERRRH